MLKSILRWVRLPAALVLMILPLVVSSAHATADYPPQFDAECGFLPSQVRVGADVPASVEVGDPIVLENVEVVMLYDDELWGETPFSGGLKFEGFEIVPLPEAPASQWAIGELELGPVDSAGTVELTFEFLDYSTMAFGQPTGGQCVPDNDGPLIGTIEVVEGAIEDPPGEEAPDGPYEVTSPVTGSLTIAGVKGDVADGAVFNGTLDDSTGRLEGKMDFPRQAVEKDFGGASVVTDQRIYQIGSGAGVLSDDGTATWEATYGLQIYSISILGDFPDTCRFEGIKLRMNGTWDAETREVSLEHEGWYLPRPEGDVCGGGTSNVAGAIVGADNAAVFNMTLSEGQSEPPAIDAPVDSGTENLNGEGPNGSGGGSGTPGAKGATAMTGSPNYTG